MESKPKVFVSSTIYDFADLRSALKYWLNEMGFEVYMSEYNDFRKDSADNSYNACLNAIQECDYYILLIGSRVGGLFSDNPKISITQKEYREANRLFENGKIKKMFAFVRKDIWTIREDRKALHQFLKNNYVMDNELSKDDIKQIESHESTFIKDADFIFSFIKEVGKVQQMKDAISGNSEFPNNNWINTFNSFEDIITVLKVELNIQSELSYLRWSEIVAQEITQNLSKLCFKTDGKIFPYYSYISNLRDILPKTVSTKFTVDKSVSYGIFRFLSNSAIHVDGLRYDMIRGALQSGIFLRYDINKFDYRSTNIQKSLFDIIDNISRAQKIYDTMFKNNSLARLIEKSLQGIKNGIIADSGDTDIVFLIALFDSEYNIVQLSRYLMAVLKSNYDDKAYPELHPTQIFPDDNENNDDKDITQEEIYDYLTNYSE